jgi:hypothetical protein
MDIQGAVKRNELCDVELLPFLRAWACVKEGDL